MITIGKPTISDINSIQEVLYKTWLFTYPNERIGITREDIEEKFKKRFSNSAIKKRREEILNVSKNKLFLVAKDKGMVVGVCKASRAEKFNQLEAIYLLPDYQGRGIGQRLWEKALEFIGKDRNVIVHVATYNDKAISFYKKLGFIETGKHFCNEKFKMPISGSYISETELIKKSDK